MHLLFTGASGFLGKNTLPVLSQQFQISTVGLTPDEDYQINLCTTVPDLPEHFDIILHAAGKAHSVPKTEAEKQVFYDINYQGTVNLCQALEKSGLPRAFIFISTVAVYGCEEGETMEIFGSQIQMMDVESREAPFGILKYGFGNSGEDRNEGSLKMNSIFTNTLGPIFVLNPWLTKKIVVQCLCNIGVEIEEFNFDVSLEKKSLETKTMFTDRKVTRLHNCK